MSNVQEHSGIAPEAPALSLEQLPEPCLLAILHCCAADDQRSVFSAARLHSRLYQAAVVALRSITAVISTREQLKGVRRYLRKHGHNIDSLYLKCDCQDLSLYELPLNLQLSSLKLIGFRDVQLQPAGRFQGVLGASGAASLKQLHLEECCIQAAQGYGAALSQLPAGLQALTLRRVTALGRRPLLGADELQRLQQLTHLHLTGSAVLPPRLDVQELVGVIGLHAAGGIMTASMLSGMPNLTHLHLSEYVLDPAVLAGKTNLLHLDLSSCVIAGGAAGEAQLLSDLQHLQQLTHLNMAQCLQAAAEENININPPAAAYAALTASSQLQVLIISGCTLPTVVWQQLFPAGKQLPHLRTLDISSVKQPRWMVRNPHVPAPDSSSMVSCCPRLQCLAVKGLQCSPEWLAPLRGLRRLHRVSLDDITLTIKGPGDKPAWRRLQRHVEIQAERYKNDGHSSPLVMLIRQVRLERLRLEEGYNLAEDLGTSSHQEGKTTRHIRLEQKHRRNGQPTTARPQKKQAPVTPRVHRHLGIRWGRGDR